MEEDCSTKFRLLDKRRIDKNSQKSTDQLYDLIEIVTQILDESGINTFDNKIKLWG